MCYLNGFFESFLALYSRCARYRVGPKWKSLLALMCINGIGIIVCVEILRKAIAFGNNVLYLTMHSSKDQNKYRSQLYVIVTNITTENESINFVNSEIHYLDRTPIPSICPELDLSRHHYAVLFVRCLLLYFVLSPVSRSA